MVTTHFMTDKEKLQKLFEAALRVPDEQPVSGPVRAFVPREQSPAAFQPAFSSVPPHVAGPCPASSPAVAAPSATVGNAGLDDASSAELAALLDERHKRITRKRRIDTLVTLIVLFGLTGGGYAWFVGSPKRVQAFHETMNDFHSLGDISSVVAKYRKALDRLSVRSKQIDQSTESMGVSSKQDGAKDPYFDKEMSAMMGGDGKTIGQRNRALQAKFGYMQRDSGKAPDPAPTTSEADPPAGKQ